MQGARLLKLCDREVDAMEDRLFATLTPLALEALRNALITLSGRSGAVKKARGGSCNANSVKGIEFG